MAKKACIILLSLFAVAVFSGMVEAKLIKIGTAAYNGTDYNLIYEDDQDLIWLDYSNPATRWPQQINWSTGLNVPGTLTYKFDQGLRVVWNGDWRLPETVDGPRTYGYNGTTTAGFGITTSEMGRLYYRSLGNLGYYDVNGKALPGWGSMAYEKVEWGLKKTGPFANLVAGTYWSGTEYSAYPDHAWSFNMYFGSQHNSGFKSSYNYYAMAVRPGKVVTAAAP